MKRVSELLGLPRWPRSRIFPCLGGRRHRAGWKRDIEIGVARGHTETGEAGKAQKTGKALDRQDPDPTEIGTRRSGNFDEFVVVIVDSPVCGVVIEFVDPGGGITAVLCRRRHTGEQPKNTSAGTQNFDPPKRRISTTANLHGRG